MKRTLKFAVLAILLIVVYVAGLIWLMADGVRERCPCNMAKNNECAPKR